MSSLSEAAAQEAMRDAITRALRHVAAAQSEEGSWKGDYGGPMFLLPMYVGTCYAADIPLDDATRADIVRYFRNTQREDGSFGLHVEGPGMVFTTVLSYVALRLLGVRAEEDVTSRARAWFQAHGGPLASASWGKFFLAVLSLYEYEGLAPVPPELWMLPRALPFHPSRMWCHARMVYLPMSWLYGTSARIPVTDRVQDLRRELYEQPYHAIQWSEHRWRVSPTDEATPITDAYKRLSGLLGAYERVPALRRRALAFVLDQIGREDRNTDYICIGPVNKLLHTLVWAFADPEGPAFARHRERLEDYVWRGPDGTKMQGYNSSELWDTTFMVQAILATGQHQRHDAMVRRAYGFIDRNQVREDVPEREACFRDPSKGGWPFSTREHGWPITDCTAEGLKSAILLERVVDEPIAKDRLRDALILLLGWQNPGGGWASYERTRGPTWLESLNPSQCFAQIMVDYPYVECTSACLHALAAFKHRYPGVADDEIIAALADGVAFLLDQQREDGSWFGSWGICFTYGTWFGVSGLRAAGAPPNHVAIQRACEFLFTKQLDDGGWGELAESSRTGRYVSTATGQAVMTSWALLALLAGGHRDHPAVARGVAFLLGRQRPDGSWPPEHIAGMFNRTCGIHYDNYLKIFPMWALGSAAHADKSPAAH